MLIPEDQFGLSRSVRVKRVHEIVHILRKHNFLQGFTPEELRALFEDLGPELHQSWANPLARVPRSCLMPIARRSLSFNRNANPCRSRRCSLRSMRGSRNGIDREKIFASIDPHPLGSASLAQVHRATLTTGEEVAIKVQRPGVRATMAQDIDVMRSLARRLSHYMKDAQMVRSGAMWSRSCGSPSSKRPTF